MEDDDVVTNVVAFVVDTKEAEVFVFTGKGMVDVFTIVLAKERGVKGVTGVVGNFTVALAEVTVADGTVVGEVGTPNPAGDCSLPGETTVRFLAGVVVGDTTSLVLTLEIRVAAVKTGAASVDEGVGKVDILVVGVVVKT